MTTYPIITVTVDLVVFRESPDQLVDHDVLLIKRGEEPFKGRLALPGGHLNVDEKAIDGAIRELQEETGVSVTRADMRFVCMLDNPDRDPRGRYISFVYRALVDPDVTPKGADDADWAGWMSVQSALSNSQHMAFDHGAAIARAHVKLLAER